MNFSTFGELVSVAFKNPIEFSQRLSNRLEAVWESCCVDRGVYSAATLAELLPSMELCLGVSLGGYLNEAPLRDIEAAVLEGIRKIPTEAPFTLKHNADFHLARFCYALARALRPEVVLETGVAYGVSSAFLLKALEVNKRGLLCSIDLPPLGRDSDEFAGVLVPKHLRGRWKVHRGPSRKLLLQALREIPSLDLFVHDSLHSYRNMSFELRTIAPFLSQRAVVIADDVQANSAFHDWIGRSHPCLWAAIRENGKDNLFGISVFRQQCGPAAGPCPAWNPARSTGSPSLLL